MPARTVEDQQGDGTDADALADFGQVLVPRCLFMASMLTAGMTRGGAGAARRADGAEQVGPSKPPVAADPRTRAAFGPDAGQRALLADPRFILKPDFNRPAGKLRRDCGACQLGEVFLKASCASRSLCG